MRKINFSENEPPLRQFLPPRPNKIARIKNKIVSVAKLVLNYFTLQAADVDENKNNYHQSSILNEINLYEPNNSSGMREYSKSQKIAKKKAAKLVKYSEISSDQHEETQPVEETQKKGKKIINTSNIRSKPYKLDEVIIYANKRPQSITNKKNIIQRKEQKSSSENQEQDQLLYSQSLSNHSSQINFEFKQQNPQQQLDNSVINFKQLHQNGHQPMANQFNSKYQVHNINREDKDKNKYQKQGYKNLDAKNPRKRVKLSNQTFLSCLQQMNKLKMKVYNEVKRGVESSILKSQKSKTNQIQIQSHDSQQIIEISKQKVDRQEKQDMQIKQISLKQYRQQLNKKLTNIMARKNNRAKSYVPSPQLQLIKTTTEKPKISFDIEKVLQIVRQDHKKKVTITPDQLQKPKLFESTAPVPNIFTPSSGLPQTQSKKPLFTISGSLFGNNNNTKLNVPPSNTDGLLNKKKDKEQEQKKNEDDEPKEVFPSLFSIPSKIPKTNMFAPKQSGFKDGGLFGLGNKIQLFKNVQTKQKQKQKQAESSKSVKSNEAVDKQQSVKPSQTQKEESSKQSQIRKQQAVIKSNTQKSESNINSNKPAETASIPQQVPLTENPFLKKPSANKQMLPTVMQNLAATNSLFGKFGENNSALFSNPQKKSESNNNQFSTPTKNVYEKYPQMLASQQIQHINEPAGEDESSMFDESEYSAQRGASVDVSPFRNQQKGSQQIYAYQNFTNQNTSNAALPSNTMNMFSETPTSFLKVLPKVDVQKSLLMFGTQSQGDPLHSLWGTPAPPTDNCKKSKSIRNKKQTRIV